MKLRWFALSLAPFTLACLGSFGRGGDPELVPAPGSPPSIETGMDSEPSARDSAEPADDLTVDQAPDGDVTCYAGSLNPLDLDRGESTVTLTLVDLVSDEGLEDVEFALSGSAPGTTDDDGDLPSWALQTCEVLTGEASGMEIVPTTTSFILPSGATRHDVVVVTQQTFQIVPSLLGQALDDTRGHVWGRVLDCSGQPLDHVEVRLGDATPNYMRNAFPNRDQEWTSEDGWFLLTNAPTGAGTVSAWIWRGGEYVRIAAADVTVEAGSVRMLDLGVGITGHGGAPPSCL